MDGHPVMFLLFEYIFNLLPITEHAEIRALKLAADRDRQTGS